MVFYVYCTNTFVIILVSSYWGFSLGFCVPISLRKITHFPFRVDETSICALGIGKWEMICEVKPFYIEHQYKKPIEKVIIDDSLIWFWNIEW